MAYFWLTYVDVPLSVNCSERGTWSHFVAGFESDVIGSWPDPATLYGPPGPPIAAIEIITDDSDTVEIVDSGELGSQGLRLTRGFPSASIVNVVPGVIGGVPHTSGKIFIDYMSHGETISEYLLAGTAISVHGLGDNWALSMKLFDGSYHILEGDDYVRMDGSYDPNTKHFVHIELNMDTKKYAICINDEEVAADKEFLDDDFTNLRSLTFFSPQTVTEAFPAAYVVDEIRITKP